jgi:hypothetical protein
MTVVGLSSWTSGSSLEAELELLASPIVEQLSQLLMKTIRAIVPIAYEND